MNSCKIELLFFICLLLVIDTPCCKILQLSQYLLKTRDTVLVLPSCVKLSLVVVPLRLTAES